MISNFRKINKLHINQLDITTFFSKFLEKNKNIIKVVNYDKTGLKLIH